MIEASTVGLAPTGTFEFFESTDGTRSNWDPEIQHGSPPLALMTKRICLMVAEMSARRPDGTERAVARVTAWLLATSDTADVVTDRYPPLVEGEAAPVPHNWVGAKGYLETVSWRRQQTAEGESNVAWLSPTVPLVDSEEMTDLQRLATIADSVNGVGMALDPEKFVFMNTDTVVHLHRLPAGNDFGLRARGSFGPDGIGVTSAEVFDRQGFVGTVAQTLLVQRRAGDRSICGCIPTPHPLAQN